MTGMGTVYGSMFCTMRAWERPCDRRGGCSEGERGDTSEGESGRERKREGER